MTNLPYTRYPWKKVTNVANPETLNITFDKDRGYLNEENGASNWKISGGLLSTDAKDCENLAYIHVFEKNASANVRVRINDTYESASFSLLMRYNCEDAFVKLVYDDRSTHWYILGREGADFPLVRYRAEYDYIPQNYCDKYKKLETGKWYDIGFTVDGDRGIITVDGEELLTVDAISHISPGRIGISAKNMNVDIESFDLTLLSGQGTVWKNVKHTKLPDERYREGGSVFEMKDGTLVYTHHSQVSFESKDNGSTWERREHWTDTHGYVNILRLKNGDFMKMIYRREEDGKTYVMSQTSSDDGATWIDGGKLLETPWHGNTTAYAGNMNDKITQISSGRVFYGMNYEVRDKSHPVDGRIVFCEFYYSDDNGATWTKSETDSWELPGNEGQVWFGECKILECDDGTLRMYNSWNNHGCVVYSESHDCGVTWGALTPIPELVCARSSMQFVKDTYADNETTYYMVWVYSEPYSLNNPMTRSRLSLAKSTDGKNWAFLGDLWRWEHSYMAGGSHIAHVVDAFIKTTKDYVICGAGYSEKLEVPEASDNTYHHAQRQHVYSIPKSSLVPVPLKPVN